MSAKIETGAAVENLEGIIEAAGAIMIARGDLGSELGIEELPHLQLLPLPSPGPNFPH